MDVSAAGGIAAEYSSARTQKMAQVAVKQQAQAEQAVATMVEEVTQATPQPGQGQKVDIRV